MNLKKYNVFDFGLLVYWPIMTRLHPQDQKYIMYCRQRRTDPRQPLTGMENFVKSGFVVLETCKYADRQTDRHTHKHAN